MSTEAPSISILLPFYREDSATLIACLDSLQRQTLRMFECHLIGDGPAPGALEAARAVAKEDSRFHLHLFDHAGIVAALNAGLSAARGDYIARMDADDTAHPDRLALQLELARSIPGKVLIGSRVRIHGGMARFQQWLDLISTESLVRAEAFVDCAYPHPTWMAPADEFVKLGGYREGAFPEDYDLFLKMVGEGWRFARCEERLVTMRHHPDRLTVTDSRYTPEAFRDLKWVPVQDFLSSSRHLWIVGGGKTARSWLRRLMNGGYRVDGLLDIRTTRIGKKIYGVPVSEYTPSGFDSNAHYLVAVPRFEQRQEIRTHLTSFGFVETRDYICVT